MSVFMRTDTEPKHAEKKMDLIFRIIIISIIIIRAHGHFRDWL